jgi:hypothetical protein
MAAVDILQPSLESISYNDGVPAKQLLANDSGYLPPAGSASSHAFLISALSSFLSMIFNEPPFSTTRSTEMVSGLGKKSSPCARIHVRLKLAGSTVTLLRNIRNAVDEFKVFGEVLSRESRRVATQIGCIEVLGAVDSSLMGTNSERYSKFTSLY